MKFKTDENLPVEFAEALREAGHDAVSVYDQRLTGRPDVDIAGVCRTEERALVTLDTDFANVQRYPPSEHCGIIVMRLAYQDKPYVLGVVPVIVRLLASESIEQRLWIVEESRVRIRA